MRAIANWHYVCPVDSDRSYLNERIYFSQQKHKALHLRLALPFPSSPCQSWPIMKFKKDNHSHPVQACIRIYLSLSLLSYFVNVPGGPPGDNTQSSQGVDSSAQIWTMCLTHADKYDKALVETWKGDMDGILIFVRSILLYTLLTSRAAFSLSSQVFSPQSSLHSSSIVTKHFNSLTLPRLI